MKSSSDYSVWSFIFLSFIIFFFSAIFFCSVLTKNNPLSMLCFAKKHRADTAGKVNIFCIIKWDFPKQNKNKYLLIFSIYLYLHNISKHCSLNLSIWCLGRRFWEVSPVPSPKLTAIEERLLVLVWLAVSITALFPWLE